MRPLKALLLAITLIVIIGNIFYFFNIFDPANIAISIISFPYGRTPSKGGENSDNDAADHLDNKLPQSSEKDPDHTSSYAPYSSTAGPEDSVNDKIKVTSTVYSGNGESSTTIISRTKAIPDTSPTAKESAKGSAGSYATRKDALLQLEHLVVLPCHGVWIGDSTEEILKSDKWILQPFQSFHFGIYFEEIEKLWEIVQKDPKALGVFSGGQTSEEAGPISEALSYYRALKISLDSKYHKPETEPTGSGQNKVKRNGQPSNEEIDKIFDVLRLQVTTEDFARDSFENILFSIARFFEVTGHYPEKITVLGYEHKRHRISDLHRNDLRFRRDKFEYIGFADTEKVQTPSALEAEKNVIVAFEKDYLGCQKDSPIFQKKRLRNPFDRVEPYAVSCPALSKLFQVCPTNRNEWKDITKDLPWLS